VKTLNSLTLLLPFIALFLGSCASLEQEPWENFKQGTTMAGASTGWAVYEAKLDTAVVSGPFTGAADTATTDLAPNYGLALKAHHFVTDNLALGAIFEYRSFDPDPVTPIPAIGSTLTAGDFETYHYIASSRYYFPAFSASKRWKPYAGLDLAYIPEVNLGSVAIDYHGAAPNQSVNVKGNEYWTLGLVLGATYLLSDNMTLDLGAFYEHPLTTSDASVNMSNAGTVANVEVSPRGLIGFVGFSYSF